MLMKRLGSDADKLFPSPYSIYGWMIERISFHWPLCPRSRFLCSRQYKKLLKEKEKISTWSWMSFSIKKSKDAVNQSEIRRFICLWASLTVAEVPVSIFFKGQLLLLLNLWSNKSIFCGHEANLHLLDEIYLKLHRIPQHHVAVKEFSGTETALEQMRMWKKRTEMSTETQWTKRH